MRRLGSKINVPERLYPHLRSGDSYSDVYIEIKGFCFYYIVLERGEEIKRTKFYRMQDLLYMVFRYITFDMGCENSNKIREEKGSWRQQLWSYQKKLLFQINPGYAQKFQQEVDEILRKNPD